MLNSKNIKKIVYTPLVGDLFHYGHLQLLKFANSLADYHICSVLTDKAVESYRKKAVCSFEERRAIISELKFVDRIIEQDELDPTENLKEINKEFRGCKIFIVFGSNWEKVPGEDYITSAGIEVIKHPYYDRLSEFNIVNRLMQGRKELITSFEDFSNYFSINNFVEFESNIFKKHIVSTKANTLRTLQPLVKKSRIEKSFVFTISDWHNKEDEIYKHIKEEFDSERIVIRSSAINEDTFHSSMAGCFYSELNVPANDRKRIGNCVNRIIKSYKEKEMNELANQILVQKQTTGIKLSGVLLTRTLENYSPYYVINYDDKTQATDSVTKGIEGKVIYINRFSNPEYYPSEMKSLMEAVKEIEIIIPNIALDIEFAIDKNDNVIIFQVRPIATNNYASYIEDNVFHNKLNEIKAFFRRLSQIKKHLGGSTTYFGDMPDWNPAEIIGDNPNYLDYSLYDYIITDSVWHQARTSQYYYNVNPAKLVIRFGNKPYIDCRNTFNSFIPKNISIKLRHKLVNFYLEKLKRNPHLQDKVEFDIVFTCYDFYIEERLKELLSYGFKKSDIRKLKNELLELTNKLIKESKESIKKDIDGIKRLKDIRIEVKKIITSTKPSPKEYVRNAKKLLDSCKEHGTLQFSRLARLAFIGKILLKSLVKKKVISEIFYHSFLESISTVATQLNYDFNNFISGKMSKKSFLEKYGHLRPGTYDINSQRYDLNPNILHANISTHSLKNNKKYFNVNKKIYDDIKNVLKEHKMDFSSEYFLDFVKEAIEKREFSKFEFTKNLSDAIELIAQAGILLGFTREEMSQLSFETIFKALKLNEDETKKLWKQKIQSNLQERKINNKLKLPPIIFSERDFDIVTYYDARPNFITQKKVKGAVINLDNVSSSNVPQLDGRVVILEKGDPGYDWIFTKNPLALITKYGGVASHMSIRCAEFGIPAAIGCGNIIFDMAKNAKMLYMDCALGKIMPLDN